MNPPLSPAGPVDLPHSPAAERNAPPILTLLQAWLPGPARVLELASGTGQHAAHFAAARPDWQWQPSEPQAVLLPAIAARCAGLPNALQPLPLDVMAAPWPAPVAAFDALFCANLLHISPWPVTAAVMRGAAACLVPGGVLVVYGPFVIEGEPLAPSNADFDADLRQRNAQWGLRHLHEVIHAARQAGLHLEERVAMPANNLLLRFRREGGAAS